MHNKLFSCCFSDPIHQDLRVLLRLVQTQIAAGQGSPYCFREWLHEAISAGSRMFFYSREPATTLTFALVSVGLGLMV